MKLFLVLFIALCVIKHVDCFLPQNTIRGGRIMMSQTSFISRMRMVEQDIKDLNLEEMFDVFEEADKLDLKPSSSKTTLVKNENTPGGTVQILGVGLLVVLIPLVFKHFF